MRIDRLDLMAYGPFTGQEIDLTSSDGVHVIYGPNEAGKSSSLRAIIDLLYGIPARSADSHLHKTTQMRIGALLQTEDGPYDFVRKKGNKNTILGRDDNPHSDPGRLARILGDVNRDMFSQMFAIDHERLRAGGQSLEEGKGSLAESLFGAGLGNDVRETLKRLKGEAEAIFKKTGTKPSFNVALREFKEHKKEANGRMVKPQQWKDEQKLLNSEQEKAAELNEKLADLSIRLGQLKRVRDIAPHLSNLRRIEAEVKQIGDMKMLPLDAPAERKAAQKDITDAENAVRRHESRLKELRDEKALTQVDAGILASAEIIDSIIKGIGQHETNEGNVPSMKTRLDDKQQIIVDSLRDIGRTPAAEIDAAAIEGELPTAVVQSQLRNLLTERAGLDRALADRQERFAAAEKDLEGQKAQPSEMKSEAPSVELTTILARVADLGSFERDLAAARSNADQKRAAAESALAALSLLDRDLGQIMALSVPGQETIRLFIARSDEIASARRDVKKTVQQLEDDLHHVSDKLTRLASSGKLATESELDEARSKRDEGWRLVKRSWLDQDNVDEAVAAFGQGRPLHDSYEDAVGRADEIGDILRLRAKDAAELALARGEQEQLKKRLAEQEAREAELDKEEDAITAEWTALWTALDEAPRSPREMESWSNDLARLKERIETAEAEALKAKQLEDQINGLSAELARALVAVGQVAPSEASLAILAATASAMVREYEESRRREEDRLKNLARCQTEYNESEQNLAKIKADLESWQQEWTRLTRTSPLTDGVSHDVMETVLERCAVIAESIREIRGTNRRLVAVRQQMDAFESKVKELAAQCGLEELGASPLLLARDLATRLQQARNNENKLQALKNQIADHDESLRDARENGANAEKQLQALLASGGCETVEELVAVEEKSARLRELATEREKAEIQITSLGDGGSLDDLIEECAAGDPDEAKAESEKLEREKHALEAEVNETLQSIGKLKHRIEEIDQGQGGAESLGRATESLARCRTLAEDYARLSLAIYLLENRMRSYEEESRGPIFENASRIFKRITLGSFHGLDTEYDDHDKRVIVGRRNDGESVALNGFSDGSADQLYLSLRLASLEQRLEAGPVLPFIVDDIFVHFDDDRTAATLEVLGELAARTQVFLFTHHKSVSDSAVDVLGASRCVVHELGGRSSG